MRVNVPQLAEMLKNPAAYANWEINFVGPEDNIHKKPQDPALKALEKEAPQ